MKNPIPRSVSRHMAALAKKANQSMRGTHMAHIRARKAAKKRWTDVRKAAKVRWSKS